jgi:dihydropteroate synthase
VVIEQLPTDIDITRCLHELGVDGGGVSILASKARLYIISIKGLHVGAANILKQDALSVGADLAVPKGTVVAAEKYVDTLLIATEKQLQTLSRKELAQPFGLKEVAREIQAILKTRKPDHCAVMGVLNANDDSFFSQSRFKDTQALQQIEKMIQNGAEIIDIGAVSSRPGAQAVSAEAELERVKPIIDLLQDSVLLEQAKFSIDTFQPSVARYALEHGFHIINDITGLENDALCEVIAEFGAQAVIMHMKGAPQTMQQSPYYDDLLDEVYSFLEARIAKAKRFGISDIVLDVGIGFGKRLEDNLKLITHLEHFLRLERPLLVGASRKSMINMIDPSDVSERMGGSLALHLAAAKNGAAIIRVHDVQEHVQALKVQKALLKGSL